MLDKINMSSIWTVLVGAVMAVVYAFNTFATKDAHAEDVEGIQAQMIQQIMPLKLSVWYGQYYDRLDDYDEAVVEENEELAKEYGRQMEKLKAQICEEDKEWERC